MTEVYKGIAAVWMCGTCGQFKFYKPEIDAEYEHQTRLCSPQCWGRMTRLADYAVIPVIAREGG